MCQSFWPVCGVVYESIRGKTTVCPNSWAHNGRENEAAKQGWKGRAPPSASSALLDAAASRHSVAGALRPPTPSLVSGKKGGKIERPSRRRLLAQSSAHRLADDRRRGFGETVCPVIVKGQMLSSWLGGRGSGRGSGWG